MAKTIIHTLEDGSGALLLPREMLDSLNLQVGDQLQIIETDDGVILRPVRDSVERQIDAARDIMDKYETALRKRQNRFCRRIPRHKDFARLQTCRRVRSSPFVWANQRKRWRLAEAIPTSSSLGEAGAAQNSASQWQR
ncbi:AbrB/MazE/SpoVT family DNA-binding domain-containing protein [Bradyrhizobium sp. Arg314]